MRSELQPAITALEEELADLERQAAELRNTINVLCRKAGMEPRHAESAPAHGVGGGIPAQIKPDTFYGKKMQTAAREFLEMRKRADQGPATPKEIYLALVAGGFQFEAKDETTALIGMRATLRKNSATFHKLPNGQYGLKAWYPNARPPKDEENAKPARRASNKSAARKTAKPVDKSTPLKSDAVKEFIFGALSGGEQSLDQMKDRAASVGFTVGEGKSVARSLNAMLMVMQKQKVIEKHGTNWRLPAASATAH